ncbi:MAG: CapA family protein [Acidimicrobiia bacterium]|nr:CapA family protein [Acidimicrobiia bacterium]
MTRPVVFVSLALLVMVGFVAASSSRLADDSQRSAKILAATEQHDPLPTSTTTPPPRSVTMAFTGDLLPHGPVQARAAQLASGSVGGPADSESHDFTPMFELVAPVLREADLAICHLETPLSIDGTDLSGYPTFNAPAALAQAAAEAGYDGCSTASNHSWDRGRQGVLDTLTVLDDVGLAAAGTAATADDDRPARYRRNGLAIAHLSYTYGMNGFEVPVDQPWLVDLIDVDQIEADVRAARAGDADVVVVSLHWGIEYQAEPTAEQQAIAERLLAHPDIDLLVGHHAHVVQPADRQRGKVVLYGLGNFLSNQSSACCPAASQDGVIALVTLTEDGERFRTRVEYVPTWVDRSSFTIVPTSGDLAAGSGVEPGVLEQSRSRTEAALGMLGARGVRELAES